MIRRSTSDPALTRKAARGSRAAFALLYERHWADAVRTAYAITHRQAPAEDAAQDGFVRAFTALSTFDSSRPFRAWLRRIVVNCALDLMRGEGHRVDIDALSDVVGSVAPTAADRHLLRAVDALSEDRRAVVLLYYGLDLTQSEIADALDVPVGTVKSRLSRALDDLRTQLEVSDDPRPV